VDQAFVIPLALEDMMYAQQQFFEQWTAGLTESECLPASAERQLPREKSCLAGGSS
jgi:hypothetical protein